jgi:HAD superfamily hydrolase (TIGR01457 family)
MAGKTLDLHNTVMRLRQIETFMLDLDGTFYLGDQLFPWSLGFLERLRHLGKSFIFVTNNSSHNAEYYVAKLTRMGVDLRSEQVFTSGEATRFYLKQTDYSREIYLLGTPDLEAEFQNDGFTLTALNPGAVVLGFDTTLTYEKLQVACSLIRQGVPFVATHPDLNCPTPEGPIPDCGAMIALIAAATGVDPKIIGKPHAEMVEALCIKFGLQRDQVAMIGDRLYTDIAMGQQSGITSILVLSGETQPENLAGSPFVPDIIAADLGELGWWLGGKSVDSVQLTVDR